MKKKLKIISNHDGFTIVELLIAASIFSTVLIVVTQNIISISQVYYHGRIQSQTINATKNIISTISQNLQLNTTGTPTLGSSGLNTWDNTSISDTSISTYENCITVGTSLYIYQIGGYVVPTTKTLDTKGQAYGALELANNGINACPTFSTGSYNWDFSNKNFLPKNTTSVNLIPENMRLVKFNISTIDDSNGPIPKLYKIDVEVAYGDDKSFDIDPTSPNYGNCYPGHYLCAHTEIVSYAYNQQ